ncbi:Hint domain-containing protein [Primorskyibacter sp. S187A]|uniref:Hint domain-containing protein n=1 Tax=Primorskyibacter sp. S187A TaxID=3415130 RepID=UPI003C7EB361
MRTIEVAHLLPDLTTKTTRHRVPRLPVYEEAAAAFARGCIVQTVDGPVAVEDLMPGDYVETSRGPQAITWIGSTQLVTGPGGQGSSLTHLVRVMADSLGPSRPQSCLVLGQGARLLHASQERAADLASAGVLCPARDFVDGVSVIELMPPSPVQMFHIAFRRHATFNIGGIEAESYHPGADIHERLGKNARQLLLSLFPHLTALGDFGPVTLPRASRDRLERVGAF